MAMFPFRHVGLKLLSICIAGLLWLAVSGERVVERVLHAPVEFQNLPGGLEIIGNPPDTVEVRVRGSSGALSRISAGDISTVLDLRTARPGRRLFHLEPSQVSVPYGIDVVQVGPSTITMEFETSGVRKVSVEPSVEGRPGPGFEVTGVSVEPATVEVTGPEGALRRLAAAVTESVSIANATRPVREVVTIGVPDASLRLRSPQTAVVIVSIAPSKEP